MYRKQFPRCRVDGPADPVPFGHGVWEGAVPRKCSGCAHLMEGECVRAFVQVQDVLELDYGPCCKEGPTDPVVVRSPASGQELSVPRKCATCAFLAQSDEVWGPGRCRWEQERWGRPRGLDWGTWEPERAPLGIRGWVVPEAYRLAAEQGLEAAAVKLYRASKPASTFEEARAVYAEFRGRLRELEAGELPEGPLTRQEQRERELWRARRASEYPEEKRRWEEARRAASPEEEPSGG